MRTDVVPIGNASAQLPVKRSLLQIMAEKIAPDMDATMFLETVKKICFKSANATNEQLAALLLVSHQYELNPLTKEIYPFVDRDGVMQLIVGVDGWIKLANTHPQYDGMELEDIDDAQGNIRAVKCTIYRKDRNRPVIITETIDECFRDTAQWKNKRRRMLRHKATIQAIRYAFGFGGIIDDDEAALTVEYRNASVPTQVPPKANPDAFTSSPEPAVNPTEAAPAELAEVVPTPQAATPEPVAPMIPPRRKPKAPKPVAPAEEITMIAPLNDETSGLIDEIQHVDWVVESKKNHSTATIVVSNIPDHFMDMLTDAGFSVAREVLS